MIIHVTLEEGGEWWPIQVPNIDVVKAILSEHKYNGRQLYACMVDMYGTLCIYDCILRKWR